MKYECRATFQNLQLVSQQASTSTSMTCASLPLVRSHITTLKHMPRHYVENSGMTCCTILEERQRASSHGCAVLLEVPFSEITCFTPRKRATILLTAHSI